MISALRQRQCSYSVDVSSLAMSLQWTEPTISATFVPPIKRRYSTDRDWDQYKPRILQLWKYGSSAIEIQAIVFKETRFSPSLSQLKTRLNRWGQRSNLNKQQRQYILSQIQSVESSELPKFIKYPEGEMIHPNKISRVWERRYREKPVSSEGPINSAGILAIPPTPLLSPEDDWKSLLNWDLINLDEASDQSEQAVACPFKELVEPSLAILGCRDDSPVQETENGIENEVKFLYRSLHISLDGGLQPGKDNAIQPIMSYEEWESSSWRQVELQKDLEENRRVSKIQWKTEVQRVASDFVLVAESLRGELYRNKTALACGVRTDRGHIRTQGNKSFHDQDEKLAQMVDEPQIREQFSDDIDIEGSLPMIPSGILGREDPYFFDEPNAIIGCKIATGKGLVDAFTPSKRETEAPDGEEALRSGDSMVQTAIVQYFLAYSLYQHDEYLKAMENLKQPLEILHNKLGPNDSWSLRTRQLEGCVHRALCNFKKAEDVFMDIAARYEITVGPSSYETRWTYYHLAFTYLRNYRLDEIWMPIWKATCRDISTCAKVPEAFSSNGYSDLITFKSLLIALEGYLQQGEGSQALLLAQALFTRQAEFCPRSEVAGLWTVLHLSKTLPNLALFDEASLLLEETLRLYKLSHHSYTDEIMHLEVKYQLNRINILKGDATKLKVLEIGLNQDLSTWEKICPNDLVGNFNVLQALARASERRSQFNEAITYYGRCLTLLNSLYGMSHPQNLRTMNDLVSVLRKRGLVLYAQPLARNVLRISEESFGQFNRLTLRAILQDAELKLEVAVGAKVSKS